VDEVVGRLGGLRLPFASNPETLGSMAELAAKRRKRPRGLGM
jgi:hypothetical protein